MAEKNDNSKSTTAKQTVKVTAKPAATAPKTASAATPKATVTAKPAASTATPKATVTAKPATASKPAATVKPTATVKPAATPAAKAAPATAAKTAPATKTATATKPAATATAAKPAATPAAKATPASVEEAAVSEAKKPEKTEKTEKPEKVKKEKPAKAEKGASGGSSAKDRVAAIVKTDNFKIFGIIGLSLILVLCLCLGLIFGLQSCTGMNGILKQDSVNVNTYKQTGLVGYSSQITDTVERYKPVEGTHDGGLVENGYITSYPTYGSTLSANSTTQSRIIWDNNLHNSANTSNGSGYYTWMDKDGYLYAGTRANPTAIPETVERGGIEINVPQQLYKHTGAAGMYLGNVSDDEKAVVKTCTFRPRTYSSYYNVTGLYAPAGEVIKIQLSGADMRATGGVVIHIGQALYNGQANNIWAGKGMNRMPVILNTMYVTTDYAEYDEATDTYTAYVGSFLGGPIYVRDKSVTFSVTISGGVPYSHFILGVTTEEEFNATKNSTVPYFDLEVWDSGVLHSGPKRYAQSFSYEDIYKAAILWEKVSIVTTTTSNQGIVFLYDPFVAAGAAVAFPGRRSVNCPAGWMTSSLNYEGIVNSGAWGNFHEYHHNFQNYGVGDRGEVTNNGLTLVSYSLFTNISSARQVTGYGGAGLSGWNQYTSAPWALQRVNSGQISSTNGLAVYATLLHNLGQDAYIQSRGASNSAYYDKFATNTHQDMSYYAGLISSYGGAYTPSQAVTDANYPVFVPVASVYQTGRTYNYDGEKREINTMQPFVIPYGQPYTFDLRPYTLDYSNGYDYGSVVIGTGFKYTIKNVNADGINGSIRKIEDGVYEFTPNGELRSGKIYVTLEITTSAGEKVWNGHAVEDVDLVIEFQQSHETNKNVLERTTFYYAEGQKPATAVEAYESNYAGYERRNDRNHSNHTQNCNTDIWYTSTLEYLEAHFPDADPELAIVNENSVDEVRGKLYFPEAGTYNIYLRGRRKCALYYSLDGGKTYQLGVEINVTDTSSEWRRDKYVKLTLEGESWVYFKEVLVNERMPGSNVMTSFIGLGIGTWSAPLVQFRYYYIGNGGSEVTVQLEVVDGVEKYYTGSGNNKVYVSDDVEILTETLYFDASGNRISGDNVTASTLLEPVTISYATAYRQSYEFKREFTSDYFYNKKINYNYESEPEVLTGEVITQTYVTASSNYVPWENTEEYAIENLFDGNPETYIHSGNGNANKITASNPAIFTVELSENVTANKIRLYPSTANSNHISAFPKDFKVEGSLDGETWFDMGLWSNKSAPAVYSEFTFYDTYTFKYYKLTVTATNSGTQRLALADIAIVNVLKLTGNGNNHYSPDREIFTYKGDWKVVSTSSSYGHVYVGTKATVEFEFEGTRFALSASKYYGRNYEIYVDGKLASSIRVNEDNGDYAIVFLSDKLSEGKHKVVIYCPEEGNIDSVAVW